MVKNWRKSGSSDALSKGLGMSLEKAGGGTDLLFGGGELRDTVSLRIGDIDPNPDQPRRHFDAEELRNLATSLKEVGQLSPILVKHHVTESRRYLLIAGERRWRAATLAGFSTIMAHILPSDTDGDQIALIENLQRVNLSPIEEAEGIQRLIQQHGYNQEEAGDLLSRSRTEINTTLTLLRLDPEIRANCVMSHSAIPKAVLLELARMEPVAQRKMWPLAARGELTTRAARHMRRDGVGEDKQTPRAPSEVFSAELSKFQKKVERVFYELQRTSSSLSDSERTQLRELQQHLVRLNGSVDKLLESDDR